MLRKVLLNVEAHFRAFTLLSNNTDVVLRPKQFDDLPAQRKPHSDSLVVRRRFFLSENGIVLEQILLDLAADADARVPRL